MRNKQAGFSLPEVMIAAFVGAIIVFAAYTVISSVLLNTQKNNNHMTVNFNLEQAGYWISQDVKSADSVTVDDLTSPTILVVSWMVPDFELDPVYYTVTYSVVNSGGIDKLQRLYESSSGVSQLSYVADYLYYNTSDPTHSTELTYNNPTLNLKAVVKLGQSQETKNFEITRRPNF